MEQTELHCRGGWIDGLEGEERRRRRRGGSFREKVSDGVMNRGRECELTVLSGGSSRFFHDAAVLLLHSYSSRQQALCPAWLLCSF